MNQDHPSAGTPAAASRRAPGRRRWGVRARQLLLGLLPWALLAGLGLWLWRDPVIRGLARPALDYAARVVFALLYASFQLAAILWFVNRSRVEAVRPGDSRAVTFQDYWGQPTLVRQARQWISLLVDHGQFAEMGGRHVNGILLSGPPGVGKNMLARAMAGDAGIPFVSIDASSLRASLWGVDALKVIWFVDRARQLAREYSACIAYVDEIDGLGAGRGSSWGGNGAGGAGALARLLYEMDSLQDPSGWERLRDGVYRRLGRRPPARGWRVLFMAGARRPEMLDPALLRPGRFDQKIAVDPPDKSGRREVIKGYLGRVRCDETVNLEAIVEDTQQATPAEIAAVITQDAVRIALFHRRGRISQRDVDIALQEQRMGIEQPIEEWDEAQRRQVAYHEAGHAVAQHYLMPEQRIARVSIIRRGGALGYVLPVDRAEVYSYPLRRLAAQIMVGMAGHVASKLHMGEYWSGAWGDFSWIRRNIWVLYSLGYFGPPVRGVENSSGGGISSSAEPLIERFWKVLEDQTEELLRRHAGEVDAIASALLERGDLSHDEVMALLGDNQWRPALEVPQGELAGGPEPEPLLPLPVAPDPADQASPHLPGERPAPRMAPPPVPPAALRNRAPAAVPRPAPFPPPPGPAPAPEAAEPSPPAAGSLEPARRRQPAGRKGVRPKTSARKKAPRPAASRPRKTARKK